MVGSGGECDTRMVGVLVGALVVALADMEGESGTEGEPGPPGGDAGVAT